MGTRRGEATDRVVIAAGFRLETPLAGVLAAAAAAARAAGAPVVLTPAPAQALPDELFALVDLLVPNEPEAAALTGHDDVEAALGALLERVPEVVVTLGSAGCLHGIPRAAAAAALSVQRAGASTSMPTRAEIDAASP